MASHLSSIGFSVESPDDLVRLAQRLAPDAEALEVMGGKYLRWHDSSGVELWLQLSERDELMGMMPFFRGDACQRVSLAARVPRQDDTPLDGAFYAWANPPDSDPYAGDYPFVFDSPDHGLYTRLELPYRSDVRLVAFAHELTSYESVDAFDADQDEELELSPEFFLPTGLFGQDGDELDVPLAHAVFAGEVLAADRRGNSVTGVEFQWAKVRTLGGEVDVVAAPELIVGGLVAGGIVRGTFWLTGRLVDYEPRAQRGFLGLG